MKTPIQELIDKIKQFKYSEINEQAWGAYDDVIDIAESLLKKEKEQIVEAWIDDRFPLDKEWVKQCAENYYNETFNTKENG